MNSRMLASTLALVVVLATMSPALAAAQTEETLDVSVVQAPSNGQVTLEVTGEGIEAENASVNITSNTSYVGNGTYDVSVNGSIDLPAPDDHVTINVTAQTDEKFENKKFDLVPYNDSLSIDVTQHDEGSATVTVTQYGEPVDGANVEVAANRSYAGNGSYTTEGDGNVSLPAPKHAVNISVTASRGDLTESTHAVLRGPHVSLSVKQTAEGNVSIRVRFNGSAVNASVEVSGEYGGAGSYMTGGDGKLLLPAPTHNTTITVTATYKNDSATTTANLTVAADETKANDYAESLVAFIHMLQGMDIDGPLGQQISEFVHAHNPSSADDDAGPPEHAGPPEEGDGDDGNSSAGNDSVNTQGKDDDHGPPAHAGPDGNASDAKNGSEHGPPDHAGPKGDDSHEDKGPDADDDGDEDESEDSKEEKEGTDDEETDDENESEDDAGKSSDEGSPGNGHGPPRHAKSD
ncbi:MAG: hypothetical protein ABEJ71_04280 [Halodesulfurarchaeum sp.]